MLNRESINKALEDAGVPEEARRKAEDNLIRQMEPTKQLNPWRFPRHPVKPKNT